jgi:hypothetical protein
MYMGKRETGEGGGREGRRDRKIGREGGRKGEEGRKGGSPYKKKRQIPKKQKR